ncbi:uncharacterized protein LOC144825506 isoform X2 [Lissotriton helveticus]
MTGSFWGNLHQYVKQKRTGVNPGDHAEVTQLENYCIFKRTLKRRTCGPGTMETEESYTPRICRDNIPAQCNIRAIAAPPSGVNPRNYWEAKCTGTPPGSSSNSDSDVSTMAEPTGLTYAQGTGLPSLSLTLLLVAALLVKRKVSENRKMLLSVLCVVLMSGLLYLILSEISSCKTDSRLVQLLQRKLREMVKVATALLEHGAFESEGDDMCGEEPDFAAPPQKLISEHTLTKRCKERDGQ